MAADMAVLRPESLFALGEIRREREIPDDLEAALAQTAPQALLRDLHRTVQSFTVAAFDFTSEPLIRTDAGGGVSAENRRILLASYRVPMGTLIHTASDMRKEFLALKAIIAKPWTDAPKMGWMKSRVPGL